jgi:hypothetical protein
MAATAPIPWRWWLRRALRLRPVSAERRLRAELARFRAYVAGEQARAGAADGGTWTGVAGELLKEAEEAVSRGDTETAWSCLQAAQRAEILGFEPSRVRGAATALYHEASSDKLGGWRAKAIVALLKDLGSEDRVDAQLARIATNEEASKQVAQLMENGDAKARRRAVAELLQARGADATVAERASAVLVDLGGEPPSRRRVREGLARFREVGAADRITLYEATLIRDEGFQNQYRRIEKLREHLVFLSLVLALSMVGILLVAVLLPIPLTEQASFGGRILAYVALFGALGGSLSAIRSVSRSATRSRIPEQIAQGSIVAIRPLFGSAAAVAAFAFLRSDVLTVQANSDAALLAVSFVAGFTERFVAAAAATLVPRSEQTPES